MGEGNLELGTVDAFEPQVSEHARFRLRSASISAAMSSLFSKSSTSLYDRVDFAGIPTASPSSTEICVLPIISRGNEEVSPIW